jgi:hypothetical protein
MWLEVILVGLAFVGLAFWRLRDAFVRRGYSLSWPWGDGLGGMGWMFEHSHRFAHSRLKTMLSEVYKTPDIGGGFHEPIVTTTFWRAQYWLLAKIFSIDDVYDFIAASGFALDGLFAYLIAREIDCSALTSFLVALGIASLEVFDRRVVGHLQLAFFFSQLIACWTAIRAAKRPTLARMIGAGVGLWFAFLGNEYYGYFTTFFCASLFIGYRLIGSPVPLRRLLPRLLAGTMTFLMLMMFSYPLLTLGRILHSWGLVKERTASFARPAADFTIYALGHVKTIFRPSLPWLANVLGAFPPDTVEFTFRLGLVVPAFASALLLLLAIRCLRNASPPRTRVLQQAAVWGAAGILLLFFSLSPKYVLSLVPLTRRMAPMFRVGVRAALFVDIAALFILGLVFDRVVMVEFDWSRSWTTHRSSLKRTAPAAMMLALFCLGLADLRPANGGLLSRLPVFKVPHDAIYDRLAALADGVVLELPFHVNMYDNPEADYAYVANRMFHHKPVLNFMRHPAVQCQATRFARDVNHPGRATGALLRELGIRYVVVRTSGDPRYDLTAYARLPELTERSRNDAVALLEVDHPGQWSASNFLTHYPCLFEAGTLQTSVDSEAVFDPKRQITERFARFSTIPDGKFLTYGPGIEFGPGRYKATFELRANIEKTDPRGVAMAVDVFALGRGSIAESAITREQLADGQSHAVVVTFNLTESAVMQFRVRAYAQGTLWVGTISVDEVSGPH